LLFNVETLNFSQAPKIERELSSRDNYKLGGLLKRPSWTSAKSVGNKTVRSNNWFAWLLTVTLALLSISIPRVAFADGCSYPGYSGSCSLEHVDLSGYDLRGAVLAGADLSFAKLYSARLDGVDLSGANLTSVRLDNTSLKNTNLAGADLTGVTFDYNTNILGTNLTGANITNASFYSMDFTGVKAGGLIGVPAKLPIRMALVNQSLIGPGVDLTGIDLSNPAVSFHPVLDPNNHPEIREGLCSPNWSQIGTVLFNEKKSLADLSMCYANLTNTNFAGDQLVASNFFNSNVTGANFDNANLWGAIFQSSTFSGTSMVGADLHQADFSGVNLGNADLSGAFLSLANLNGADLSMVNLDGATGDHIQGTPLALPPGYRLTNGVLVKGLNLKPAPSLTGVFRVGSKLVGDPGVWDPGVTVTVSWQRDGVDIPGATSLEYLIGPEDYNHAISFTTLGFLPNESLIEGVTSSKKSTQAITVSAGDLSTTPIPVVSGSGTVGSTLIVDPGTWDHNVNLAIQWLRDGSAINGANGNSYTLTSSDYSHRISVQTTGSATGYTSATKTSPSVLVAAGAIAPGAVAITGKFLAGQTLNARVGSWVQGAVISFQWLLDGKAIKGATHISYRLGSAQKGHRISLKVSQSAPGFALASKTSAATKVG
jgi:uncharacterized protein YjbI with pentapeptide repeats